MAKITDAALWPFRQAKAFLANAWGYLIRFQIDDVLPPSVKDFLNWFFGVIPRAFGLRGATPREQINASLVLILVVFLSAIPTLGSTLIILVVAVPLLFIGIFRWLPAFNELWRAFVSRLPFVNQDLDIPGWRSE